MPITEESGSQWTPRWREMDSNYRPQCEWARRFRTTGPAAIAVFEVALQRGTLPLAREGNGSTRVMAGVNSPQALREQLAHPPHMTVTQVGNGVTGAPTVRCTWFEGSEQKTGGFPPAGLQVAQTEGASAS